MNTITSGSTIEAIIETIPAAANIFDQIGIDYCCGGKMKLSDACKNRGLEESKVLEMLEDIQGNKINLVAADTYEKMSPTELVEHIEKTHHALLWSELGRLDSLTEKVARVHGGNDGRLEQVRETYLDLARNISDHMRKEELILFPLIREIEKSNEGCESPCGSVENPIRQMDSEHEDAGLALLKLRKLTDDFTPPSHACFSYRSMLSGLNDMEKNLQEHMHKETMILFPKIIAMEQEKLSISEP